MRQKQIRRIWRFNLTHMRRLFLPARAPIRSRHERYLAFQYIQNGNSRFYRARSICAKNKLTHMKQIFFSPQKKPTGYSNRRQFSRKRRSARNLVCRVRRSCPHKYQKAAKDGGKYNTNSLLLTYIFSTKMELFYL